MSKLSQSNLSEWKHKVARDYFPIAVKKVGEPTFYVNVKGGMVRWLLGGNSLFSEHLLIDERVAHCVPRKHLDFFYSSVKFYVPPNKLLDVLKISGSITYDGLKKELTARCGSIEANIATLYLAMKVASGALTIQQVKNGDLYYTHISGEAMKYSEMKREMNSMKKVNKKRYEKKLKLPRYDLAFKKC